MQAIRHVAALGCCLVLAACNRLSSESMVAGAGALPQHFEITVDGAVHSLSPDEPKVSQVSATVLNAGTGLTLAALDKSRNLNFALVVAESRIAPGDFLIGRCGHSATCTTRSQTAVLAPYPDGRVPDPLAGKMAYDYPELGLKPAMLTLTQVEDAVWPGVGPAKRIRGSFKGDFATVQFRGPDDRDHVLGPVRRVEGRFDLYAALR